MNSDTNDYKYFINLAINNAKARVHLLKKEDQKCILEEYKEWIEDDFSYKSVLFLREDPII